VQQFLAAGVVDAEELGPQSLPPGVPQEHRHGLRDVLEEDVFGPGPPQLKHLSCGVQHVGGQLLRCDDVQAQLFGVGSAGFQRRAAVRGRVDAKGDAGRLRTLVLAHRIVNQHPHVVVVVGADEEVVLAGRIQKSPVERRGQGRHLDAVEFVHERQVRTGAPGDGADDVVLADKPAQGREGRLRVVLVVGPDQLDAHAAEVGVHDAAVLVGEPPEVVADAVAVVGADVAGGSGVGHDGPDFDRGHILGPDRRRDQRHDHQRQQRSRSHLHIPFPKNSAGRRLPGL